MNHPSIYTTTHKNHNPTRFRAYTVNFHSQPIRTVVTSTPAVARNWVYTLRRKHSSALQGGDLMIGLGVQWRPTFSSNASPEAATLQLCVDSDCLIFQLRHASAVPATLRKLLVDDRITFVGVRNGRDKRLLEECEHGLKVGTLVNLASVCRGNWSMERMAAEFLGFDGVAKPLWVGMSDWEEYWLDTEQIEYACLDAYVSYLLAKPLGFPRARFPADFWDDGNDGRLWLY